MGTQEMSHRFDVMLNSYASQAQFGEQASNMSVVLDEFEKSVLLTQAQEIVLKAVYNRKKNAVNEGLDDSEERQIDFSTLITTAVLERASDQTSAFDDRGIIYNMPSRTARASVDVFDSSFDYTFHSKEKSSDIFDSSFDYTFHSKEETSSDVMFILNERIITQVGGMKKSYVVVPIHYREYDREMSRPYGQPLKKQVWRLIQNNSKGIDAKLEIIPRWNLTSNEEILEYKIRYIRRPYPIVLTKLENGLNIEGFTQENPCELAPILHEEVLNKAVELAMASRGRIASPNSNN
jgi:hypothetical protein